MNVSEAHAVNQLLHFIFDTGPIPAETAAEAGEFLAGRAHQALGAGVRPQEVREFWPQAADRVHTTRGLAGCVEAFAEAAEKLPARMETWEPAPGDDAAVLMALARVCAIVRHCADRTIDRIPPAEGTGHDRMDQWLAASNARTACSRLETSGQLLRLAGELLRDLDEDSTGSAASALAETDADGAGEPR